MPMHKFPRGYKQFKVLEYVSRSPRTYTEIIKFAYELSNGEGSFDPVQNRGYWSGIFQSPGSFPWNKHVQKGWGLTLMEKKMKLYFLTNTGRKKLRDLREQFGASTPSQMIVYNELGKKKEPVVQNEKFDMSKIMDNLDEIAKASVKAMSTYQNSNVNSPVVSKVYPKEPLLKPRKQYEEDLIRVDRERRLNDVKHAIQVHIDMNLPIPQEWYEEYEYLIK